MRVLSPNIGAAFLLPIVMASTFSARIYDTGPANSVSCPVAMMHGTTKLSLAHVRFWLDARIPFGPDDSEVPNRYKSTVLLDCAYLIPGQPDQHVTVKPIGSTHACMASVAPRFGFCEMEFAADAVPPETHFAETVGKDTLVGGFMLGRDIDELREFGSANGYLCAGTTPMVCDRANEKIEVFSGNGRSDKIEFSQLGDQVFVRSKQLETVYRFGLSRTLTGPDHDVETWINRKAGVRLGMPRADERFKLILEKSPRA
jgi:hypothetical protein